MLNINGKQDESYRYKMCPINSNIMGKGNGLFTSINNLNEVCKYINHPPNLLLKFLSLYFGSMSNEDKMSITGSYSNDQLQKALQVYINRFVICSSCSIPETIPQLNKITKKSINLELKCSACGLISEIKCNNKIEEKTSDLIIKYLEKNIWGVASKGTMVNQNNICSNTKEEDDNSLDPFR